MVSTPGSLSEVLVVGGGVVGLSLAWELAGRGARVTVLDKDAVGRAASWAGAGILPPPPGGGADHPLDDLTRLSRELHPRWAQRLLDVTGIDTGYRECGGLYLARSAGELAALLAGVENWRREGLQPQRLDDRQLLEIEPGLATALARHRVRAAFWFPTEAQLRNPRHLQALQQACRVAGVVLHENAPAKQISPDGTQWTVQTPRGEFRAGQLCVTSGAWSSLLLQPLGVATSIVPIRGQMLLFRLATPPIRAIVNEGPRYLVPRDDGLVLAGSTEEEAGFDATPTEAGMAGLQAFAQDWLPQLDSTARVASWAGLRPASVDGFPYLGRVPGRPGLFLAAGHFRSGLLLSPGTAQVMADLMTGVLPSLDLSPFNIQRGLHRAG